MTFQCEPAYNVFIGEAMVSQTIGHKLARGQAVFFNDFPGVPCTGGLQTSDVTVSSFTSLAFKQGKAGASASLEVFNPATGEFITRTTDVTAIRIAK